MSRRRRAQSLLELALTAPVIVMLFFGTFSIFTGFQRQGTYIEAAQSLGEWVARTGSYDESKRQAIESTIGGNPFVALGETNLHITVLDPAGVPTMEIGELPDPSAGNATSVADSGWSSVDEIAGLARGSSLIVTVWAYHRNVIPFLPALGPSVPFGQSVQVVFAPGG